MRWPEREEPRQPSWVSSDSRMEPFLRRSWASLKSCHEAALRRVDSSKEGIGVVNIYFTKGGVIKKPLLFVKFFGVFRLRMLGFKVGSGS